MTAPWPNISVGYKCFPKETRLLISLTQRLRSTHLHLQFNLNQTTLSYNYRRTALVTLMPHSYSSLYPSEIEVDDGIKDFFENFYRISDTPDSHDRYVDSFKDDATLVMGSKKAVGRGGVSWNFIFSVQGVVLVFYSFPSLSNIYKKLRRLTRTTEILELRKGMWTLVASRLHDCMKIIPFGSGSGEFMLYGAVAYTLKDGRKANVSLWFSWPRTLWKLMSD